MAQKQINSENRLVCPSIVIAISMSSILEIIVYNALIELTNCARDTELSVWSHSERAAHHNQVQVVYRRTNLMKANLCATAKLNEKEP